MEGYIHDNNTGAAFPEVLFVKSIKNLSKISLKQNSKGVIKYGVKPYGNSRVVAPLLFPRTFGSRHIVAFNESKIFGKEFYKILPLENPKIISIAAQMNSTFAVLQRELIGLVNLGDGALKFSADDIKMFVLLADLNSNDIEPAFRKMAERESLDLSQELKQADRRELDEIVFDALDLTQHERNSVYEAVTNLIESRLNKASSLKPKDRVGKRLEAVERTQGIWQGAPDFEDGEA